jgi:hypothetical protein
LPGTTSAPAIDANVPIVGQHSHHYRDHRLRRVAFHRSRADQYASYQRSDSVAETPEAAAANDMAITSRLGAAETPSPGR